jgi:hypothetical protein
VWREQTKALMDVVKEIPASIEKHCRTKPCDPAVTII